MLNLQQLSFWMWQRQKDRRENSRIANSFFIDLLLDSQDSCFSIF